MLLQWNLQISAFILIASIIYKHVVDGRTLVPAAADSINRRAPPDTCTPRMQPILRNPPPALSQKPVGDADVDEGEEDDDELQSSRSNTNITKSNFTSATTNPSRNRHRRRSLPNNGPGSRQALIEGGRKLWQELQFRLNNPTGDAKTLCDGFDSRWDLYKGVIPDMTKVWPRLIPEIGFEDKMVWEEELLIPKAEDVESVDNEQWICYRNLFSTEQNAIVAVNNRAKRYNEDGAVERAPDHWSTAAMVGWSNACKGDNSLLPTLKYIIRDNIYNLVTTNAMDVVLRTVPWETLDGDARVRKKVLTPNDGDLFFMMLRTPNFIGVMHMLSDFVNTLGRKTIKEVGLAQQRLTIDADPSAYAWVTLENDDGQNQSRPVAGSDGLSISSMAAADDSDPFYKFLSTVEIS